MQHQWQKVNVHWRNSDPMLAHFFFCTGLNLEQEAYFISTFPPTWVMEGNNLTLQCTFTPALQATQQDVSWFRDGESCYHIMGQHRLVVRVGLGLWVLLRYRKKRYISCDHLPSFLQDVWQFKTVISFFYSLGTQLHPSSTVGIKTADNVASITLRAVHKENEGVYTVRVTTWKEIQHSAYVYVKGKKLHWNGR